MPTRASVRTLSSLRPLPVPPMATTMSALSSFSAASSVMSSVTATPLSAVDGAGNQRRGAANDVARAGAHHAHARLADQHALDAERGEQRHVDPAQARAGQPQLKPGGRVGVRRQHAFAGRDRGERRRLARRASARRRAPPPRRRRPASHRRCRRAPARATAAPARRSWRRASRRSARHSRRAARAPPWDGPRRSPRSAASVRPSAFDTASSRGSTGPTDRSKLASTSASGVSRAIRWISESATMRGT